jgi:hypothetical protein
LHALIRVVDQRPWRYVTLTNGHIQRRQRQFRTQMIGHPLVWHSNGFAAGTLASLAQPITRRLKPSSTTGVNERLAHPYPMFSTP